MRDGVALMQTDQAQRKGCEAMRVLMVKSTWGMTEPWPEQIEAIARAGYDAVEVPITALTEPDAFFATLKAKCLLWVGQVFSTGGAHDVREHIESFQRQVEDSVPWKPLLLDAHTARDVMSFDEQCRFYEAALAIEQRWGVAIGHETHRSRAMFTPWTTAALLNQFPALKVTADLSHWVNVCESYLEDHREAVDLTLSRTIHIHGRVGHPEGPQVPDPAAPEWAEALARHEVWWDQIRAYRTAAGQDHLTFDPEFGPPGYMPTLPHSGQPVADLWRVCAWMAEREKSRWSTAPG